MKTIGRAIDNALAARPTEDRPTPSTLPALRDAALPPDAVAAEQRAIAIRAELGRRPDAGVIRAWLDYVAACVARPRPTEDEIVLLTGVLLDGEYPAAVFNPATRRAASRRFKHWPAAAEVFELLAPEIEAMGVELPGLDRTVRNARRPPIEPAREAFGYDPGPAAPEVKPRGAANRRQSEPLPIDAAEVDRQLAALGVTREAAAKLRERKTEPEAPEYGGPGLHVVETDPASAPAPVRALPAMRKVTKPRSHPRPGRNL
jgi:hypothetical protein